MKYPPLRAYIAAIKDKGNIKIPFFKSKSMQIFLNRRGAPYMSVGGFGAVFRYKDKNDNQYGLKVFTRDAPGRAERYQILHDTLQITKFPFMVDFQYVQEGIKVGNSYYPVVAMEWGRGIPINSAISQDLEDDGILQSNRELAGHLFSIVKMFGEWNMGHGDFQEGNLLVRDDNRIVLIDYDGMYVPSLEGKGANEVGLADYQHPERSQKHFGSAIDHFALLSILYQLSIINPELWNEHHDDKRLILRQKDYKNPMASSLIMDGLSSEEDHVRELAVLLSAACQSKNPLELNIINELEDNSIIMDWLTLPPASQPDHNYTSIINQVVSLTDQEMEEFETSGLNIAKPETVDNVKITEGKTRKDSEGSWGFITNLIFENTEDDGDSEPGDKDKSSLSRFKKSFMGLLFEEDEEDKPPAPASGQRASTPAKQSPSPQPPSVASVKQAKVSTQQDQSQPKQEKKAKKTSAPVPDWLKKRKRSS